jgi:hypothetical protein
VDRTEICKRAGQASAKARLLKNGTAIPKNAPNIPNIKPNIVPNMDVPNSPNALTLTLTHSLNSSLSPGGDVPIEKPKKSTAQVCWLFDAWNFHCDPLSKAKAMSPKRLAAANARIKENSDKNYWIEVVKRLANSQFCCGSNDRGWKADIDFLLKPDTHIKVMEGKYDDKTTVKKPVEYTKDWGLGQ